MRDGLDHAVLEITELPAPGELAAGLDRAVEELLRLGVAGEGVDAAIARILVAALPSEPEIDPQDIRALQELDRLLQHLAGLASYLHGLAEAARGAAPLSCAFRGLRNAALVNALQGAEGDGCAGEAELF